MRHLTLFVTASALLLAFACGDDDDGSSSVDARASFDGAVSVDAAAADAPPTSIDATVSIDGAVATDDAAVSDAGPSADGNTAGDASTAGDANTTGDANTASDANTGTDGGVPAMNLYACDNVVPALRQLNPATGATLSTVTITLSGSTVAGCNGMATHPTTNVLYVILRIDGIGSNQETPGRSLVTVAPATGVATLVGATGDNISSIAFDGTGTLYGVTGESVNGQAHSLYTINTTTGALTLDQASISGDVAHALAFNPDDGLMYHVHGGYDVTPLPTLMDTINLTSQAVTPVTVSGLDPDEAGSMVWSPAISAFLYADVLATSTLYSVTTAGVITQIGVIGDEMKGLAWAPAP